eukprot:COSAG02_NODE_4184_length_5655_cov_2.189885_3_plen_160_part_00
MLAFPCICTGYFFLGETAREKSAGGADRVIPCLGLIHDAMSVRAIVVCFTLAFGLLFGLGWPEVRKNTMWPEAQCTVLGSVVRTYANCHARSAFSGCQECSHEPRCSDLKSSFASSDDNTHVVLGTDRYNMKTAHAAPDECGGDYYCCDELCDECGTKS